MKNKNQKQPNGLEIHLFNLFKEVLLDEQSIKKAVQDAKRIQFLFFGEELIDDDFYDDFQETLND